MTREQKLARLVGLKPEMRSEALNLSDADLDIALAEAEEASASASAVSRIDEAAELGEPGAPADEATALSLDEVSSAVSMAVRKAFGDGSLCCRDDHKPCHSDDVWIRIVYPDSVVFEVCSVLYQVEYSIDGAGAVTFTGEPVRVRLTPERADDDMAEAVQVSGKGLHEAIKAHGGALVAPVQEAKGSTSTGSRWEMVIIQAGESLNRREYSREVLEAAAPLYEGVNIYRDHEEGQRRFGRSVDDVIGFVDQVRPAMLTLEAGSAPVFALTGRANITDETIRGRMLEAFRLGKPGLYGFSHSIEGRLGVVERDGRKVETVEAISKVRSVDLVTVPAAGGRAVGVAEAKEVRKKVYTKPSQGDTMREKLIARLKALRPDILEALGENPTDEALDEALAKALEAVPAKSDAKPAAPVAESVKADSSQDYKALTESVTALRSRLAMSDVDRVLAESTVPAALKTRIRKSFEAQVSKGVIPTEAEIAEAVQEEINVYSELVGGAVKATGGQQRFDIQFGAGKADKVNEALDDFFNPDKPAMSIRNLYIDITGDRNFTGRVSEAVRLNESIGSTTFDQVFGDSIARRMVAMYQQSDLNKWRLIANVVPVSDFRTQRRMRFGGYGNLSAVAQGAPYLNMTSPTDEEATYAISKYGGLETINIEALRNDDVGALRDIPRKLARAAAQTLHEFVFDFLGDNAAIYDTVALAATGHANIVTSAISDANIETLRLKMKNQTDMSSGKKLGLAPRYIFVPNDLEKAAWQFTKAMKQIPASTPDATAESAVPNYVGQMGLTVVPVEYWSDANDYWLAASKDQTPLIEIGFLDGREDPELFVQDMPNVGSMFSNDALTYKMRHPYGGAVIDYRGFAAGIVA